MNKEIGSVSSRSGKQLLKMWQVCVPGGVRTNQRHSHMQFEISLVNYGTAIYETSSGSYEMREGDVFVFTGNEQHCITNVMTDELIITNLQFNPSYLWGSSFDSLSEENSSLCFSHSPNFENRIPAESAQPIAVLINQIAGEFIGKKPEYHLACKSLLNNILLLLIREYNFTDSSLTIKKSQLRNIRTLLTYIDEHYTEKLSLEQLAKSIGMSPNYLSALFKKISNITLWEYINLKRVESAIHMITDPANQDSMLEVALKCGFNNTANFNKAFRRHTGMTPTEYRTSDTIQI